ncbi:MAG TPA: fumarylacetoacetate hydrolase family protein [Candidatus Caenarcaniphilales bacterium]|nr:fumarylacetoacetate hydrolase family protein [Candidatus Caenarcaniphilales bacterium]
MRLVSYRTPGAFAGEPGRSERLGVQLRNGVVAAEELAGGGPTTMADLLSALPESLDALRAALAQPGNADAPQFTSVDELELLPPVPRPGKIVAVGINYRSHAEEQGREPPDSPVLFAKFSSALIGHRADVRWDPALTEAVDFEAELAVVIGRRARHIDVHDALEHVLGYTCLNDVSARDLQYADRQFVRAKSLDTFCPMGPALVTADEITDPQALALRCLVNGEVMQSASTADMVFGVAELIAFCSRAFTLEPGDVIATGTPAGVGWFREPKRMLRDGDEVVVEIDGVGTLVNRCREEAQAE